MDSVCRSLSVFPCLKTVTVTWQSYSADVGARLKGVELFDCWNRQRTLELLQSFRKLRGERPEVGVLVEAGERVQQVLVRRNNGRERRRVRGLEEFMGGFEGMVGMGK